MTLWRMPPKAEILYIDAKLELVIFKERAAAGEVCKRVSGHFVENLLNIWTYTIHDLDLIS